VKELEHWYATLALNSFPPASMSSQSGALGRHKAKERGSIACKRCRQAKVRCGMSQPPCTRCVKNGFNCVFDPAYRRINTSERFERLESHIKSMVGEPDSPASPPHPMRTIHESFETIASPLPCDASVGTAAGNLQIPTQQGHATTNTTVPYSIGRVHVSPDHISMLFSM
jgi:hypothetical protein